jgi:hypothetical protein
MVGAKLLTEWEEIGDYESRPTVESYGTEAMMEASMRFDIQADGDGQVRVRYTDRIEEADGTLVAESKSSGTYEEGIEPNEVTTIEDRYRFLLDPDPTVAETGQSFTAPRNYVYKVSVEDLANGGKTEFVSVPFTLIEKLGPEQVEFETDIPDEIQAGEQYRFSLTFTNLTDQDNSVTSPYEVKIGEDGTFEEIPDRFLRMNVPAGESVTETWTNTIDDPGKYIVRLPDIDRTYTFNVV